MCDKIHPLADRIAEARRDGEAQARLLAECCERALRGAVEREVGSDLPPHLSASDLIQETLQDAHRGFDRFRGQNEAELVGWLRTILRNNLCDALRKRRIKVRSLPDHTVGSSAGVAPDPPAPDTSPSQRVIRSEQEDLLAAALETLPPRQRLAVTLRHLQGRALKEVATTLGCTEVAAAGLLKRGLESLRRELVQLRRESTGDAHSKPLE